MKEIKTFFGKLFEIVDRKIEEMNRKEAQRIEALKEQNRKNIEEFWGVALRKRWASALNALPVHIRISRNEIDHYSLSNIYRYSYWEVVIPIQELLSKSKCKELQEQLNEILKNQSAETRQKFEQKIYDDSNEYAEQIYLVLNGKSRTKDDFFFGSNYEKFVIANYYRLVSIEIIGIECIESKLHIQYKIDESTSQYFHCNNYWRLINQK